MIKNYLENGKAAFVHGNSGRKPVNCLTTEINSTADFGCTKEYHFYGSKVPITGVAGDQQAALFGQLALKRGQVKNTYGTGAFTLMNLGQELKLSKNRLLTTMAYGYVVSAFTRKL